MSYPLSKLISGAYYECGIVPRGLALVNGYQASDGLDLFNEILAEKSIDSVFLPYFTNETITLSPGIETYFILGLTELETLTFNVGNVRFAMNEENIQEYNATGRVDDLNSLPCNYYLQRKLNGTEIKLYPKPSSNYILNILGKFSYPNIANYQEDLSLKFDSFQILYFKYKLAYRLLLFNRQPVPVDMKEQLDNLERRLHDLSGYDWSINKMTMCSGRNDVNYMRAALKDGFYPLNKL